MDVQAIGQVCATPRPAKIGRPAVQLALWPKPGLARVIDSLTVDGMLLAAAAAVVMFELARAAVRYPHWKWMVQ